MSKEQDPSVLEYLLGKASGLDCKSSEVRCMALLTSRAHVGREKYGRFLFENQASVLERLRMIREELADAINYSFWLEDELRKVLDVAKSIEGAMDKLSTGEKCDERVGSE